MKTSKQILLGLLVFLTLNLDAQIEYIGAGSYDGVNVVSSSNGSGYPPENTLNGSGMDVKLMEASRFLSQATLGYNMDEINTVVRSGMNAWIDDQMNLPVVYFTDRMEEIWDEIHAWNVDYYIKEYQAQNPGAPITDEVLENIEDEIFGPWALDFHYTWWEKALSKEDQLRQKVAYALSQILVVSINSDLSDHAHALTTYYDILYRNAFGSYRDILEEVTLSSSMGLYLSHYNNPREVPEENLHPDENYAREIMQLFTIGLYELNQDGTRKVDANGNEIPTYNNGDIKELAKVFTGLGPGGVMPNPWVDDPQFGLNWYLDDKMTPMKMYEEWHEKSSKTLLGREELPANQAGMKDIEMTLDFLFNHENVGPFISRLLIQRLVKSNPSPSYISRVAGAFNNNGQGERGDLAAVVRAILLDEEARSCEAQQAASSGKLTEPMLRHIQLGRGLSLHCYKDTLYTVAGEEIDRIECTEDRFWMNGFDQRNLVRQSPLGAPNVFNFYLPDHQPVGDFAQMGLVGPEFKIHDTSSAINFINMEFVATIWGYYGGSWNGEINEDLGWLAVNIDPLEDLMPDPESVYNYLDVVFLRGAMTDRLRNELRTFVNEQPNWVDDRYKARGVLFLVMISPEFAVLK